MGEYVQNMLYACMKVSKNYIITCPSSQCWDYWIEPVQILWLLPQSTWVHRYISPSVPGSHCFLGVMHHLWLLQFFCLLSSHLSEPCGEGFSQNIPFRTQCPNVCHFLHIVHSGVSHLREEEASLMWTGHGAIKRHFIVMFLYQNNNSRPPLRQWRISLGF